jgi:hypothetical protein
MSSTNLTGPLGKTLQLANLNSPLCMICQGDQFQYLICLRTILDAKGINFGIPKLKCDLSLTGLSHQLDRYEPNRPRSNL